MNALPLAGGGPQEKICEGCGKTKNVLLFSVNKTGQPGELGRQRMCKKCTSRYMKRRYLETEGADRKKEQRRLKAQSDKFKRTGVLPKEWDPGRAI